MTKDPLIELGKIIREQREARGWSLEDFAKESRLSVKFIHAIEEGRRDELPEEAFLMGFLNIAARTLALDKAAIDSYKDKEASFILETIVNDDRQVDIPKSYRYREPLFKIYHLYIFAAVIFVFLLSLWIVKQIKPKATKIESAKSTSLAKQAKTTNSEDTVTFNQDNYVKADAELSAKRMKSSGRHHLTLKAKRKVWLQVVALGENNILFEGYISPQSTAFSFADDMGLFVSTTDAGALDVDIGRGYYLLGSKGQELKWYYPPSAKMKYKEAHGSVL